MDYSKLRDALSCWLDRPCQANRRYALCLFFRGGDLCHKRFPDRPVHRPDGYYLCCDSGRCYLERRVRILANGPIFWNERSGTTLLLAPPSLSLPHHYCADWG